MSALTKAKDKLALARKQAAKGYARVRESEKGRMYTDGAICGAAAAATGFAIGAYPDATLSVGIDVHYSAVAGAAALAIGIQTGKRELTSAGYGALLANVVIMARDAGSEWV